MTIANASRTADLRAHDARPQLPRGREVLREHVRAIGLALRTPMLIAAVLAVLTTLLLAVQIASGDIEKHLLAEPSTLPGIIGALLPIAIWAREERFGPGFLWTLPVDRSRHALIKVLAGWLWLAAGLALYALCQAAIARVSDGALLPVKTMYLLTASASESAPIDRSMLRLVRWSPGPVVWVIPGVSATATYLLASALMLGIRHPLRWIAGGVVVVPVASVAAHALGRLLGAEWVTDAPARAASQLLHGRFGLEMLLTLRTWSLDRRVTLTSGERLHAWSAVPDLGDWGVAALLWTAVGLLALLAAAYRHRERRRA